LFHPCPSPPSWDVVKTDLPKGAEIFVREGIVVAEYYDELTNGEWTWNDAWAGGAAAGGALMGRAKAFKGAGKAGSVGATRRLTYKASPKHGPTAKGSISAAPRNGQEALDLSIQVKPTSPRRVGIDYETGEFNVFDQTTSGVFHGHVRTWNQLTSEMQHALRQAGMVDARGRILGGQ